MVTHDNDNISLVTETMNFEDEEPIDFTDMNMLFYYEFKNL